MYSSRPSGAACRLPCDTPWAATSSSASPSVSVSLLSKAGASIQTRPSRSAVMPVGPLSSTATGASLTETTATATPARAISPLRSVIRYSKPAAPWKSAAGVKITLPMPSSRTVPLSGVSTAVSWNEPRSGSRSLPIRRRIGIVSAWSSSVATLSSLAIGVSFTARTSIATLACALRPKASVMR